MSTIFKEKTPYIFPQKTKASLLFLSEILNIPASKVAKGSDAHLEAMCGTILYRHLNQPQRDNIMALMYSLGDRELTGMLIGRVLNATFINPHWHKWSLSYEEIVRALKGHNQFNRLSSLLGANPGAYGLGAAAWSIWKARGVTAIARNIWVAAACVILIGLHEFSNSETNKLNQELSRRLERSNKYSLN